MGNPDPVVIARLRQTQQLLSAVREALIQAYSNAHDAHEVTTEWVGDDRERFRRDLKTLQLYVASAGGGLANQINAYDAIIWDYEHGQG